MCTQVIHEHAPAVSKPRVHG